MAHERTPGLPVDFTLGVRLNGLDVPGVSLRTLEKWLVRTQKNGWSLTHV